MIKRKKFKIFKQINNKPKILDKYSNRSSSIEHTNSNLNTRAVMWVYILFVVFFASNCQLNRDQPSMIMQEANLDTEYTEYFPFESYVWAYWDEPIEKAPLFTRLSYERLRMTCEDENLTLTLLSEQNLHEHIEDYERNIADLVKRAKVNYRPTKSDLIRLTILEQKGGIWMDIGCMSIERQKADSSKLMLKGWIERLIKQQKYLVSNAYTKEPQVIVFYASFYMNKAQFWDSEHQTTTNEFPGFDTWFIVAKKGSQFIKDFKRNFIKFYLNGFEYMTQKLSREQIFQRGQDQDDYLTINLASSYTIQQKQKELDRNLSLLNPLHRRKTVFEEYGLWSVHGTSGPVVFAVHLNDFQKIFTATKEELQQESGLRIRFMIKFAGYMRKLVQPMLDHLRNEYTLKFNNNFTVFIESKPSKQTCTSLKFIVEGSLFSYLLLHNKVNLQQGIPVITVKQRDQWLSYCASLVQTQSFFSSIGRKIDYGLKKIHNWGLQGRMDKVEYADRYELYSSVDEIPFWDEVEIFLRANTVRVFIFVALWVGMLLIVMPLLAGLIKLIEWGIGKVIGEEYHFRSKNQKYQRRSAEETSLTEESSEHNLVSVDNSQSIPKLSGNNWLCYAVFVAYYTTFIIVINFFFNVTIHGGVNQVFFTFAVTIGTFTVESLAQKYLKISDKIYLGWSYQQLKVVFGSFIRYCLCSSILFLFQKRCEFLVFHTIVIAVMCPIMLQILYKEASSDGSRIFSTIERFLLKVVFGIQKFHRQIVVGVLLMILLFPNLPYIVREDLKFQLFVESSFQKSYSPILTTQTFDIYYINYLPLLPLAYAFIVAFLTLRVIFRQSLESLQKLSSTTTTDQTSFSKLLTVIKLSRTLLTLGILLMMLKGSWNLRYYIVRIISPLNRMYYEITICLMFASFYSQIERNGLTLQEAKSKKYSFHMKNIENGLRSSPTARLSNDLIHIPSKQLITKLIVCFSIPFLYTVIGSYQNVECNIEVLNPQQIPLTHNINYAFIEIPIALVFGLIPYIVIERRKRKRLNEQKEGKKIEQGFIREMSEFSEVGSQDENVEGEEKNQRENQRQREV